MRRPELLRRLRCARGTATIEVAIVFPLLMLIVLGIFDFSRMFYTQLTMQHAVREAVRFAITGNAINDPGSGSPLTRVESIRAKIAQSAVNLNVDVDAITITPSNGGGPGDVVTVSSDFSYEFTTPLIKPLFPSGTYDFSVSSSMKNEPFYTD